jgi:twitching motility protein PilT
LEEIATMCSHPGGDRLFERLPPVLRVMASQTLLQRCHSQGRVPLLEILINNQAVTKAILARSFPELPKIMDRSRGLGMQTIDQGLKALLARKLVAMDEALYHATDREWLYQQSRG